MSDFLDHRKMSAPERLRALADFLEMDPRVPSAFDMKQFGGGYGNRDRYHQSAECGTAACAAGWATALFEPLFLDCRFSIFGPSVNLDRRRTDNPTDEFFGLPLDDDTQWLSVFSGRLTSIPAEAAARLRKLADEKEARGELDCFEYEPAASSRRRSVWACWPGGKRADSLPRQAERRAILDRQQVVRRRT